MTQSLPARSEVPIEFTADLPSLFATPAEFDGEVAAVNSGLPDLTEFKGHLGDSPATLADWFGASEAVRRRLLLLHLYAYFSFAVDSGDQAAAARVDRMRSLASRVETAMAFAEPELIGVGFERLLEWSRQEPRLAHYEHYFDRLRQRAEHVRSEEVEEVLSAAGDTFQTAAGIHGVLNDSELRFEPATDAQGRRHEVAQGTISALLTNHDRELRRTAYDSYADAHLGVKSTLASCIATGVKRDVFLARTRRYPDSLHAALEPNHVPVEVFHGMLDVFGRNLPTWHRYWRLLRRTIGADRLMPYDTRAPLRPVQPVDWPQAVEWVLDGVAPLGGEYVDILRRGLTEERWVDVYPNRGKRMGAFSYGTPGSHPFIFMSFNDDIFSMSTLAHETGHSIHSWYSNRAQPFTYARYGLFVAEVASNFHQALVRARLLAGDVDPELQVAVLEEAMANFHRYFFIMPSLARFELEVHAQVERGEPITAPALNELMADLMGEVYGQEVAMDGEYRERVGCTWAQFHTHLYSNFYVYQYATGIAGANWLADRVLGGDPGAAEAYVDFLKLGGSRYPLDALKAAGVDMSSPEPVEKAFQVMAGYVTRLEKLLG